MFTHMSLANRLQSVDTPSISLSDLHHLSERTAPNNFKKLKGVDGKGWTLGQRIEPHSFGIQMMLTIDGR
jgi:hypothetical protein